jgi:hypothetical protein
VREVLTRLGVVGTGLPYAPPTVGFVEASTSQYRSSGVT